MKIKKTLAGLVLALAGCAEEGSSVQKLGLSSTSNLVHQSSPLSYNLDVVTKSGARYALEVSAYRKGVIVFDPVFQRYFDQLHFYEAGVVNRFRNVQIGDYVVLTDKNDVTSIVRYFGIDPSSQRVFFEDAAVPGVVSPFSFNSLTRVGKVSARGQNQNFAFIVEFGSPYRLGFDNNGDGLFDGDVQSPIVKSDGSKIFEEDLLPK